MAPAIRNILKSPAFIGLAAGFFLSFLYSFCMLAGAFAIGSHGSGAGAYFARLGMALNALTLNDHLRYLGVTGSDWFFNNLAHVQFPLLGLGLGGLWELRRRGWNIWRGSCAGIAFVFIASLLLFPLVIRSTAVNIYMFRHGNYIMRMNAVDMLGRSGDIEAYNALLGQIFTDPDRDGGFIRGNIIGILTQRGGADLWRALLKDNKIPPESTVWDEAVNAVRSLSFPANSSAPMHPSISYENATLLENEVGYARLKGEKPATLAEWVAQRDAAAQQAAAEKAVLDKKTEERDKAIASLAPGSVQPDGTVYVGVLPDGNLLYTTPQGPDAPMNHAQAVTYAATLVSQGHRDWRLPTQDELLLLFNSQYFGALPGTFNMSPETTGAYWSSSSDDGGQIWWTLQFSGGQTYAIAGDHATRLRCVRAEPPPQDIAGWLARRAAAAQKEAAEKAARDKAQAEKDKAIAALTVGAVQPDGTIYAGVSPDTGNPLYTTPQGESGAMTHDQAAAYAAALASQGHDDWRLPSKDELLLLFNNQYFGALQGTFLHTPEPAGAYWSSTSEDGGKTWWTMFFGSGLPQSLGDPQAASLRCVRSQ